MVLSTAAIIRKANQILRTCGTRDPYQIARELDVEIIPCNFRRQRGAYKVIARNRFIYLNENLNPVEKRIVLLHELGHDTLHRREATRLGGFQEFNLFDMADNRMEYEANVFAAQLDLDDDEFLDCCRRGYDVEQIAHCMGSDVNLVALKADVLIEQGCQLHPQAHRNDFLRYDK
ncbi:MAG: ImmA/IrrE family metallo-endopeptidase [Oscillospiraceae bacterium]|nr:ImmA/IrrE family metallo-endopeptidase [Oscillospiraceae bacterium]